MVERPINVLAVLDAVRRDAWDEPFFSQLRDARDALAELIEADVELDAAYAEFPAPPAEKAAIERGVHRIKAAKTRRADALARVQGGAS